MRYETIKELSGLDTLSESTDTSKKRLRVAENLLLRPLGGAKRIPTYQRLWGMNNLSTYVSGLGLSSGSATCLLEIVNEGKVFLVFYDVAHSQTLGLIYAADTGLFSGNVTLTAGTAAVSVLKTGLTAGKRWYCYRFHDSIWMGNGVDDNLIYQYSRTARRLRTSGTNSVPAKPLLTAAAPLSVANVQATHAITIGTSTLTVTADAVNFRGTNGHNIQFGITAGTGTLITSTRSGAGTSGSPFLYNIATGTNSGQSSASAILAFILADADTIGVLTASLNTPDATDNPSLSSAMTALSGGVDATASVGYTSTVRSVYLTYWDPGTNGQGYESARSQVSAPLGILGGTAQDILVAVTGNTTGDLARFGYQRIYLSVGDSFLLVKTVANTTASVRIGSDVSIGSAISDDQTRTPPCTMFELFRGRMWASGNPGNPSRVWISKFSNLGELVPEGTNIAFYLEISGRPEEPEQPVISAMRSLNASDMHIGTQKTITSVDGVTFARNSLARVVAGPINPACFSTWAEGGTPYIGADGQLYAFRGAPNSDGSFLDQWAIGAMRDVVDIDTLRRYPHRANMIADPVNRLLWMWAPDASGFLRGFVFDYMTKGFTGPFDWPKLLSVSQIGVTDNRFVGCDEAGNLLVFDTSSASLTDPYATSSAFTYQADPYTPPLAEYGYGTVTLAGGVLRKAATTVITTPFLDFGSPNRRKGFFSLEWSTIRNSRAILSITATSDLGNTVTRSYGDVYGRERHKVVFCLSGHAIQITIRATTAEDAEFALRDITIGFEIQGTR